MQEYFQVDAISQSLLKEYRDHPRLIGRKKEEDLYYGEDKHFTKGTLVDLMVTNPDYENILKQHYFVYKPNIKLSDKVISIIHRIYSLSPTEYLTNVDDEIVIHACDEHEYFMNRKKDVIKDDPRLGYIKHNDDCGAYWVELRMSQDKIIISPEDFEKSMLIANSILSDRFMQPFFNDYETYFQKDIYVDYDVFKFKGLLDIVFVDHNRKRIIITDIKSSASHLAYFNSSIWKFRYDIQGSFYKMLVELSGFYEGYTVEFQIFAGSFADPTYAEIFYFPTETLRIAEEGNENRLGWRELLNRYHYHSQNGFSYPLKYIENGGLNIVE
jgi:hypothetical protein